MTLPIRAYLIVRRGPGDWGVEVCRDLDAVRSAWFSREDKEQSAVLHLGFDRPHSSDFEELLCAHACQMLLTASAIYGLPSSFKASAQPIGFVGDLPVHLGLTGWGYTCDDPELKREAQFTHVVETQSTDVVEVHRLAMEIDPCEIARAAPLWLKGMSVQTLDLTVRLANVFDRAQIKTVGDLANRTLSDLFRLQNFGRTSARDLKRSLLQALRAGPMDGTPDCTLAVETHDWVAEFVQQRPQDGALLDGAQIVDERSYLANEHRLPSGVRHRCGLFRFNALVAGRDDDPCEIARATPPWLKGRSVEALDLTVRLGNVFDRTQIKTVGDLAERSLADLFRIQNFGRTSASDLKRILLQALDAGPTHALPPGDNGEISHESNQVRSSLLAQIHRTLASCETRAGDILSRRMGLGRPGETLQEIADTYGVTRERIRQIESKTIRKIIKSERWDDHLTTKIQSLLTDRQYPLPVLGLEVVDSWFAGVSNEVEALRYTLANFCDGRVSIVEIGGVEYTGFLTPGEWQSALAEAQQSLLYASANAINETELRRLLAPIIPEKAQEFRALLWEEATRHCHFSTNADGERILVSQGRGVDQAVQAILFDAEDPLHYTEIAERVSARLRKSVEVRRAHNAAATVGILMGRGIYGAEKHLGLSPAEIANIAEEASSIILSGPEGKQWHAAEVLSVLTERGLTTADVDKYAIDYCLRSGRGLQGLGRMAWRADAGAAQSSQRLEMRHAIEAVLMEAGRPLSTADLRQRLVALRGVNDIFQFSTSDPLIRVGPGLWGLNDRDVPIARAEQPELFNDVFAVLQDNQAGIHVSEIPEAFGTRWSEVPAHIVLGLCNFDQRLKISVGQFIYLSEWEGPRRQSVLQTVQSLLPELPDTFTNEDVVRLVKERTRLPIDTSQISACLRSAGAIYDGANRSWSLSETSDDWDLDEAV